MKKVLVLFLIVGAFQSLVSQEPTQYKRLNDLRENSELKRKCEQEKRARFIKGKVEEQCDCLDQLVDSRIEILKKMKEDALEQRSKDGQILGLLLLENQLTNLYGVDNLVKKPIDTILTDKDNNIKNEELNNIKDLIVESVLKEQ